MIEYFYINSNWSLKYGIIHWRHCSGEKVYVTQVRGIAEARIWDNFEEWFREKLQESAPKSLSPEAESMAYLENIRIQ